jgi:hypothetical protein
MARSDAWRGIKTRRLGARRRPEEHTWLGRCASIDAEATGTQARRARRRGAADALADTQFRLSDFEPVFLQKFALKCTKQLIGKL